jgi:hypothetical protein
VCKWGGGGHTHIHTHSASSLEGDTRHCATQPAVGYQDIHHTMPAKCTPVSTNAGAGNAYRCRSSRALGWRRRSGQRPGGREGEGGSREREARSGDLQLARQHCPSACHSCTHVPISLQCRVQFQKLRTQHAAGPHLDLGEVDLGAVGEQGARVSTGPALTCNATHRDPMATPVAAPRKGAVHASWGHCAGRIPHSNHHARTPCNTPVCA